MTYEPEPIETIQNLKPGQPHYGVKRQNLFPDPEPRGYLKAIDPLTGKSKWETGFKSPNWAGTLVTAGGLLFTGTLIGEFIRRRRRYRPDRVAIPDPFRNHRPAGHLGTQRQAICHRHQRHWRGLRTQDSGPQPYARPGWRKSLDVQTVRGLNAGPGAQRRVSPGCRTGIT